jgi:hypothetical protein
VTELDPTIANAHEESGAALFEAGQLTAARDAVKRALALTAKDTPLFQTRSKALQGLEALLLLEPRLAKGDLAPANTLEAFQFGRLCRVKQHYAQASRLYDHLLQGQRGAWQELRDEVQTLLDQADSLAGLK